MSEPEDPIAVYHRDAGTFATQYESVDSEAVWSQLNDLIPAGDGRFALDIGAGSGRDAAWLARRGFEVVAAEPADGMREAAAGLHRDAGLRWLSDRLPDLAQVHRLGLSYDLILLNAVWQHIAVPDRPRAFRKMVTLLRPGGLLLLTLRQGPSPPGRPMHGVSLGEVEALARDHGVSVVRVTQAADDHLRGPSVQWTAVCMRLPDEGSGALPLIRGVILNDNKSSTYKLGLLRAVSRIADGAPSLAVPAESQIDGVKLPLGLVALYWLRAYLPLVTAGLPQSPGNRGPDGLGFAKSGFRAMTALGVSANDLRLGARFTGERAAAVGAALAEARKTIVEMPARYLSYPNSDKPIFEPRPLRVRLPPEFTVDARLLWQFGDLFAPGPLWRALQRLGDWVEPVLVAEWVRLMRGYSQSMGIDMPPGQAEARLVWIEPERDTGLARRAAERLLVQGAPVRCVWSGQDLNLARLDIDHALPWSAWPCGDLWNLLPASRQVNQHQKRGFLPSAAALAKAREPILDWWAQAWSEDPGLAARFRNEAMAALPIIEPLSPEAMFAGLEWRRLRVSQDQQPPEWRGLA